jgi:hypothetical protein
LQGSGRRPLRRPDQFHGVHTNRRGGSDILVTGVYEDTVAITGADTNFISKRAILDTVTTPRYLVYPV